MGASRTKPRPRQQIDLAILLVIALAMALGVPASAAATPTATMSAAAVPIPKNPLVPHGSAWPHTGNIAGAGAELEAHFTIKGTEDMGLPNPLRRVAVYLPKGVTIHKSGFAICKPGHLNWMNTGQAPPCPTNSFAGAVTQQRDMVNFTGTDLVYPIRQGAYFSSGGGLGFWMLGVGGLVALEGAEKGGLTRLSGAYSYKLTENQPYLYVMKGLATSGPDLSTAAITVALGAAYWQGGKLTSYVTMPKVCPVGGFPVKATLSFGRGAEPSWETVTTTSRLSCPGGHKASLAVAAPCVDDIAVEPQGRQTA